MRPPAPVHYLRANHKEWSPPAVIFLDTETLVIPDSDPETLALRFWAAHYVDRRRPKSAPLRDEWGTGARPGQLAAWITEATRNRETVWLYAHNLSFDLVTTRLPLELVAAGWEVHDAAIGGKAPWITLGRGKRVLTLVDSWSWLPMALEAVGAAVNLPKLPADFVRGTDAEIEARCRRDVAILEAAVLDLMDWWDANALGRWAISGAASGWNAYRHRPAPVQVVIDPTPSMVAADRLAVHGGRRGTWRIGEHRAGPFTELDFRSAYPMVAAELPLPIGRVRPFDALPITDPLVTSTRWGITARVRIVTDVPRWPVRVGKASWYPVGEFWADLAGPDIAEAARLGCLREIGAGWVHRLGHAMLPWARWCLDVQDGRIPGTPAVARLAAKSWGRAVIGKWAAHGFERVKLGPALTSGWGYEEAWDHTANCSAGIVSLGGQCWQVSASGTPDNAYPAILAWVEAEVRVRLGRVIEALGPRAVLQCDTDGLIVANRVVGTPAAHGHLVAPQGLGATGRLNWCLDQINPVTAPLELRVKRAVPHVTVLGPQHLVVGGERRYTGLPGMAEETAPGEFKAKLWPKLQWQLGNGDPRGYVRPEVTPHIKGPWPTGWLLADKSVVPIEAAIGKDGMTRIIGWNSSSYARAGVMPADVQNPALTDYL